MNNAFRPQKLFVTPYGNAQNFLKCGKQHKALNSEEGYQFTSFKGLVKFVHSKGRNLEVMAMIMWTLWYQRNQLRVSCKDFPVAQVFPQAMQAFSDLKSLNVSLLSSPIQTRTSWVQVQWSPPPTNCFKINFDGAMFSHIRKAGLGVVVRDCNGNVVASLSEQAPLPFSPDIAKAMAAAKVISFAQELGIRPFTLEGDSEV